MTHPSYYDDGPSSYSNLLFLTHSSPILCIVTAIEVLLELFMYTVMGEDITQAAGRVKYMRNKRKWQYSFTPDHPDRVADNRLSYTWLLLALGPLSQAVKLFGCSGIWWAHALALMYISCPLSLALLLWLAPPDWVPPEPPDTSRCTPPEPNFDATLGLPLASLTYAGQLWLYFWLFTKSAAAADIAYAHINGPPGFVDTKWNTLLNILTVYPILCAAPFYFALGFLGPPCGMIWALSRMTLICTKVSRRQYRRYLCFIGFFVVFQSTAYLGMRVCCPFLVKMFQRTPWPPGVAMNYTVVERLYVAGLIFYTFALMFCITIPRRITCRLQISSGEFDKYMFGITNFLSLTVFCYMGYNPTVTTKPRWTEALG